MSKIKLVVVFVSMTGLIGACEKSDEPKTVDSIDAARIAADPGAQAAGANAEAGKADTSVMDSAKALFGSLPTQYDNAENPITPEKVALGKMLFFETRLSKNHDVSCNSCHGLDTFGVDGKPTSTGHKGQLGGRNSPTVYNAGAHISQFWDGRAKDLEEQAKGPVLNPVEMAMKDAASVEKVLSSMPEYVAAFDAAFGGQTADDANAAPKKAKKGAKPKKAKASKTVTFDNMALAIAAFERTLVTPSRFDKFVDGDDGALTLDEKKGLTTFTTVGCVACHAGPHLGGGMYQKAGAVAPWPNQKDQGRFDLTKNDADKMMFRVPTLRNIAKTAPYFHDGATATLDDAVKMMAKHQLGRELEAADVSSIVTFLGSLTGELPADKITAPTLPKSTKQTPKPSRK